MFLQRLRMGMLSKGLRCTCTHINAVSYVMHEVTRVFLECLVLSNGAVYSRVGSSYIAMVAHAFHGPVLICCEAYKLCERVQLDSICFNELGFSPEGHKRLKSSSNGPQYSTCNRTEPNAPDNSSAVVDYSNPFAISEVLDRLDSGRFGSVTEDIYALVALKMQMLGPYFAQYPALVNLLSNKDEKAPRSEIEEVTGLTHNNVIDVEGEHIKKDDCEAPLSVVIIDSDDKDDREEKSDSPFHEI